MTTYNGYIVKDLSLTEDTERKDNNAFLFLLWSYKYTIKGILKSWGFKVAR